MLLRLRERQTRRMKRIPWQAALERPAEHSTQTPPWRSYHRGSCRVHETSQWPFDPALAASVVPVEQNAQRQLLRMADSACVSHCDLGVIRHSSERQMIHRRYAAQPGSGLTHPERHHCALMRSPSERPDFALTHRCSLRIRMLGIEDPDPNTRCSCQTGFALDSEQEAVAGFAKVPSMSHGSA